MRVTCGVNYTHVGFLCSTRMYMHMQYLHMQYLHMRVHAHAVINIRMCFTRAHACMANVTSMLASYLSTS